VGQHSAHTICNDSVSPDNVNRSRTRSASMHPNFLIQSVGQGFSGRLEIIPDLEIHPELCFHLKETAQSQGSICRGPSLTVDDLIDSTRRHANGLSYMILAHFHRLEKVLQQNFARMDWRKVAVGHCLTSMVISDLNIIGVIGTPDKADTPLIVYANARLPLSIAG
jgi:hypothetical protein